VTSLDLSVQWQSGWDGYGDAGKPIDPPAFTAIDPAILSPAVVAEEEQRIALQRNITDGWGTWANSVLDLVLMPEGARLTVGLCQVSTNKCITSTRPSDTGTMRVAEHAYDKTYVRMFLTFQGANVSVEFSSGVGAASSDLSLALTPLNCQAVNCSDFAVKLMPGWAWGRQGSWQSTGGSGGSGLSMQAHGLRALTLYAATTTSLGDDPRPVVWQPSPVATTAAAAAAAAPSAVELTFPLTAMGGGVTSTGGSTPKFSAIRAHLQEMHDRTHAKHEQYKGLAEVANAVQSAVMWCLLYVPTEIGPFGELLLLLHELP
jgi:hypothetical protein